MNEQGLVPYIIVLGFILALLMLVYVRRILTNSEGKVTIEIGNGQTIGRRKEQDDYFSTASSTNGTIAVLADGISGLTNGRMASTVVVTTFIRAFLQVDKLDNIESFFRKTALLSNNTIIQNLKGSSGGTTLVAIIIDERGYLHWGAVGDSIITIFRKGEFIAVNQKHIFESVLKERYLAGEISKVEVQENPMKKRLINYVGYEGFKNMEIGREPIKLNKGDKVCLYSDGVYNSITEVEMEKILSRNLPPYDIAQQIIDVVERKRLKNQDNATIVILKRNSV
ncbi:PP2C family protein-serine/threonine phosphatase [Sporosarcina limicola]|uniref:Serine/threonine protein phosphatase PrpC n=1 Tax=Sporosarcina limicola TaxID=34101 RepID=A0A927MJP7_9BACL|nr:protein phosphatase 2C domain-containing protein [Sporosarcina limicola]MBE1555950.1 serine/threonine protein phosphatase PrpC [Sporosarcina limicola]